MKKIAILFLFILSEFVNAQVVINEIDSDTAGADALEFIELKSTTPNFSLNGYVVVFYNGTGTGTGSLSYLALDLDGYFTDANGILVIGNAAVSPAPAVVIANNSIQNGPDAVALYLDNAINFPLNTVATATNAINAVAYANGNVVVATTLMSIFGLVQSQNEAFNINVEINSIQRKNDGNYEAKLATPGVNNDGSGIVFNYVTSTPNNTIISEGQSLNLTFSTSQIVTLTPLQVNFTIANGSFTVADYSGVLSATIPVGSTSITTSIQVLNDNINDGDEEMKVVLSNLPVVYAVNNNNQIIRALDVNFISASFGTPTVPTYNLVLSTVPNGYYNSLNGLSGTALKQALQNIIANPGIVKAFSYADVYDLISISDQNPANNNQVWLLYTEQPRSKLDRQISSSIVGKWNREHIYPQSRGAYATGLDYDLSPFGINNGLPTDANDIGAGLSDAHHIRAADGQENSSRNNKDFGLNDYNGPAGSSVNTWKGDVARSLFYMAIRYNTLSLVNGNPPDATVNLLGDLATLLQWNQLDPADDFEMNRNNYIYTWQKNRNPFIDMPNLANYIWGANAGQVWNQNLSTNYFNAGNISFYPNPISNYFVVNGIENNAQLEVYNLLGEKILNQTIANAAKIEINWHVGIYFVTITSSNKSVTKKIIVH